MNYNGGDNNKNKRLLNQWSDAIDNANEHINDSENLGSHLSNPLVHFSPPAFTENLNVGGWRDATPSFSDYNDPRNLDNTNPKY